MTGLILPIALALAAPFPLVAPQAESGGTPLPAPAPQTPATEAPQSAPQGDTPPTPPHPATESAPIVVTARSAGPPPHDPMESVNRGTYGVVQAVDGAVVGPLAMGYQKLLPRPARSGLRNALRNLTEPVVFVNYLLQLKPGKAAETLGRFTLNSTVGAAGLVDVARRKPFGLPYRANGFGNTLGYYGVGPGPYFYLPLVGPTTLRDIVGRAADGVTLPLSVGFPFDDIRFTAPAQALRTLDFRAETDAELQEFRRAHDDHYAAQREQYLRLRREQIEALHGRSTPRPRNPSPRAPLRTQ